MRGVALALQPSWRFQDIPSPMGFSRIVTMNAGEFINL